MSDVTITPPIPPYSFHQLTTATAQLIGMPVCNSGAAGTCEAAKADAAATSLVLGLATRATPATAGEAQYPQNTGIVNLTVAEWDAIAGTTGGLVIGDAYYLSAATAGHITSTAPVAGGSFVQLIGIALSHTQLLLQLGGGGPVGPHG